MKKKNKVGRRILALLLTAALMLPGGIVSLAEDLDGQTNLARGKNVVASSKEADSVAAANAVDGDTTNSRWGSNLGDGPDWIYVDLESVQTVKTVKIFWETKKPTSYKIQTAESFAGAEMAETDWTDHEEATFETHPSALEETIEFNEAVQARYVRLYIGSHDQEDPDGVKPTYNTVSIYELEVYGPAEEAENKEQILRDAIAAAKKVSENAAYAGTESQKTLAAAIQEAETLLAGEHNDGQLTEAAAKVNEAAAAVTALKITGVTVTANSTEAGEGSVEEMLDGNETTYYHSTYSDEAAMKMPQWFIFDLGQEYDLSTVAFLARQGGMNGDLFEAKLYVSTNESSAQNAEDASWEEAGNYQFENDGSQHLTDTASYHPMKLEAAKKARYVKLEAVHTGAETLGQDAVLTLAEVLFVKAEKAANPEREKLQALYDENKDRNENAYTAGTWGPFNTALTEAKAALDDESTSTEDLQSKYEALKGAVESLAMKEITGLYGKDSFKLSLTNEELATDPSGDETPNVEKLIQAKSYDALFNGNKVERNFEFLWDGDNNGVPDESLASYITLPLTLTLEFKTASTVGEIRLYNDPRINAEEKHDNGYLTKGEAKIYYENEDEATVTDFGEAADIYTVTADNAKKVSKIELVLKEAYNRDTNSSVLTMLTLAELEVTNGESMSEEASAVLEAMLQDAAAKNKDDYLADSWADFAAAVKAAEEVLNDVDATMYDASAAVAALQEKEKGLELKEESEITYGQDAFDLTITNEKMAEDPGEDGIPNVKQLIQGASGKSEEEVWAPLFNGKIDTEFEFLWNVPGNYVDGEMPDFVTLPVTMTLKFKNPSKAKEISFFNRTDKADGQNNNGYVTKLTAKIYYVGEEEAVTETKDEAADVYTFTADETKKIEKIELVPEEAFSKDELKTTLQMLTIAELKITGPYVRAEGLELAETNKKEIAVGEETVVSAAVTPADATDKTYTVTSDKEEIVRIEQTEDGAYSAVGVAAGEAEITVTASDDSTISKTYMITVTEGTEPGGDLSRIYEQSDFNISMTTATQQTDDGTNVTALIQQGNYDGLFNGNKNQTDDPSREFEFKWDLSASGGEAPPEGCKLPMTLTLEFKTPSKAGQVLVYNANKANGYVTSMDAKVTYEDDTTDTKSIGEEMATYIFNFSMEKKVKKIEITAKTAVKSNGDPVENMLTLAEIEVKGPGIAPESIKAADTNKKTLKVGEKDEIKAVITPENATNKAIKAESSDASTVKIVEEDGTVKAEGVKVGKATITITALANEQLQDSYEITVVVNKDLLAAAIGTVEAMNKAEYTAASWAAVETALTNAKSVNAKEDATQQEIDDAVAALSSAVTQLVRLADTTELQTLYDSVKDKENENYPEDKWKAFEEARDAAKAVLEKEEPTQEEVDNAKDALQAALDGLKKEVEALPFDDLPTDWSGVDIEEIVRYMYENKLMMGYTNAPTKFGSMDNIIRGDFALVLYRMYCMETGETEKTPKTDPLDEDPFPDVPKTAHYANAVQWAVENGIVTGYTDSANYGPLDYINREQVAAMLYRYAKLRDPKLLEGVNENALDPFTDSDKVQTYQDGSGLAAMKWAVSKGIIKGMNATTLNPLGEAVRAQAATMFYRYLHKDEWPAAK